MTETVPTRRPPPEFLPARVVERDHLGPRLIRVRLEGAGLVGFEPDGPAASLRLLLPRTGTGALEVPEWNGNEFLYADGARPPIRTLTPLGVDAASGRLSVAAVVHGEGPLSTWATSTAPGDEVAVSGPGRGYEVDAGAATFVIVGDESALPAILTLMPELPRHAAVRVVVEVQHAEDRIELGGPPDTVVDWVLRPAGSAPGDAMLDALRGAPLDPDARLWVAGEAAGVQRIRRHLFDELAVPRSRAVVRGYWKQGRAGAGS